jgi:hypothetical protein
MLNETYFYTNAILTETGGPFPFRGCAPPYRYIYGPIYVHLCTSLHSYMRTYISPSSTGEGGSGHILWHGKWSTIPMWLRPPSKKQKGHKKKGSCVCTYKSFCSLHFSTSIVLWSWMEATLMLWLCLLPLSNPVRGFLLLVCGGVFHCPHSHVVAVPPSPPPMWGLLR